MVGMWLVFCADTVASIVRWAATSGFVVPDFMRYDGGYLGNPVVHPHEVGTFIEPGDDFVPANPLGLLYYRGDRHEALLRSSVYLTGNLIQNLVEVPDRESLSETCTSFILLSFVVTSSVLVVGGLIGRCVGGHLIL
jgi:hypothetical protein